jgi:hypothetical protein
MNIERPIFIIGAPRSGTTLLFSILSSHPVIWSLYRESNIIERYLHPEKFDWVRGDELGPEDASPEIARAISVFFYRKSNNYQSVLMNLCSRIYTNRFWEKMNARVHEFVISPALKPESIRLVEKKPKNCLRVSFLDAIFPNGFYIFVTRDPRGNISSLIEGWREIGRFETYRLPVRLAIEGYSGSRWNFLLPRGWPEYVRGKRLEQVCAFQYEMANRTALENLERISQERQLKVRYEDLIAAPEEQIREICSRVRLDYIGGLKRWAMKMHSVNTREPPDPNKWKRNENEVLSVIQGLRDIAGKMGYNL